MSVSRRGFLKYSAVAAGAGAIAATTTGCQTTGGSRKNIEHVVVIGGGFGGATAAKYLKHFNPNLEVTMIDGKSSHTTCPFSNLVIAGWYQIDDITHDFSALKRRGVNVKQAWVTSVDTNAQTVSTDRGETIAYDRLVVSPGIELNFDAIEGLTPEVAATRIPHAWQAGEQTLLLRKQLEAMPDGGTCIIAPPGNPFRCPPGPYERAGVIASYFKRHKPNSKVVIVDAKSAFSKEALFREGWRTEYGDMVEWISADFGGAVTKVDPDNMTITAGGQEFHGDVLNVIPPQKAGRIAHKMGLADDSGWCPVNQRTYESTKVRNVHVIGDAAIASPMPKSGFAANSQGKVCAAAIAAMSQGREIPAPTWVNTCYSYIAPEYGISVAAVYAYQDGEVVSVEGAGGVSEPEGAWGKQEAEYAVGWYNAIADDIWRT